MGTLRNFYSRQKQGKIKYENPGVARHFPVLLAGLLGVGEGAGTYTGSVGGSLIHLEAHFEILEFYFHFQLGFVVFHFFFCLSYTHDMQGTGSSLTAELVTIPRRGPG